MNASVLPSRDRSGRDSKLAASASSARGPERGTSHSRSDVTRLRAVECGSSGNNARSVLSCTTALRPSGREPDQVLLRAAVAHAVAVLDRAERGIVGFAVEAVLANRVVALAQLALTALEGEGGGLLLEAGCVVQHGLDRFAAEQLGAGDRKQRLREARAEQRERGRLVVGLVDRA